MQNQTKMGSVMTAIATTTRIRMSEVAKSGAVVHPAHKPTGNWLDRARGSCLHPELMDNGWRDLQPSDRTLVKGHILEGLLQRYG